jgi:hypothetical protein
MSESAAFAGRMLTIMLAISGLSGCASEGSGLTPGVLPEPAPFVVESRPTGQGVYPAVGVDPARREDTVLSEAERAQLETELLAASQRRRSGAD